MKDDILYCPTCGKRVKKVRNNKYCSKECQYLAQLQTNRERSKEAYAKKRLEKVLTGMAKLEADVAAADAAGMSYGQYVAGKERV